MEVWKNIPNYVGIYMISNLGRIESLERKVKNGNGYRIVKRQIINSTKNNNYGNHKFRSATTQSQKVNQYDLSGNFIKTWNSMKEIERTLKIHHSCISACCKGKQKYSNGYIWKYYENKEN